MANLVYQSVTDTFTKHEVKGGRLLMGHQPEQVTPKVGDSVVIGRLYAMLHAGVVLGLNGMILEIREPEAVG